MATLRQQQRYVSASERNVLNFLSRFRGVNTGTASTRLLWLGRLTDMNFDMTALKKILGVKVNDTKHDEVLNEALSQAKSSVKKASAQQQKEAGTEAQAVPAKKKSLQKGLEKIKGKLKLSKTEQDMVEFSTGEPVTG